MEKQEMLESLLNASLITEEELLEYAEDDELAVARLFAKLTGDN